MPKQLSFLPGKKESPIDMMAALEAITVMICPYCLSTHCRDFGHVGAPDWWCLDCDSQFNGWQTMTHPARVEWELAKRMQAESGG